MFSAGVPTPSFDAPILTGTGNTAIRRWDVAPRGERFLFVTNSQGASGPGAISVMLHWTALLSPR